MNKINIIGIGPGNLDYLTPIALKTIKESDILIGGKRNLDSLKGFNKKNIELDNDLNKISDFIKENYEKQKISVVVSGDPGLFSMLNYLKKDFNEKVLNVIPGISSIQYLFSKIALNWDDGIIISLHGKNQDIVETIRNNKKVILLLDNNNTPQKVASILIDNNMGKKTVYIGNNLSYDYEQIIKDTAENIINYNNVFNLSIMVVMDE